jgi:DNA-directed RNA polymerase subunit RPC12/RpoP
MTSSKQRMINCADCGKETTYNRNRGKICWKCKDIRYSKRTTETLTEPQRCPTCGKKIVIVPCIACNMVSNVKKFKKGITNG